MRKIRGAAGVLAFAGAVLGWSVLGWGEGAEQSGEAGGTKEQGLRAGMLRGAAYLANDLVTYVWDKAENGAGLLKIVDKRTGRAFVTCEPGKGTLWRVEVKQGSQGTAATYASSGSPCEVECREDGGKGVLTLRWKEPLAVEVVVRLAGDEGLGRSRIHVTTVREDEGLRTVTFPALAGVGPVGKQDRILQPAHVGWTKPTPVETGKALKWGYPIGGSLQMTALLGKDCGFYAGEEDGEANTKEYVWGLGEAGALTLEISHPVLNYGAEEPVRSYESPGDVVLGPFQGDWYDAGRIYRAWALSAPWCAKGPIYEREDVPKWFLRVPYWLVGGSGSEEAIERVRDGCRYLGVPNIMIHDYWYTMERYQHDRNPELFPPRIGTTAYQQLADSLHAEGVRIVPYTIGWLWNQTTESYRTEQAEKKGGMCGPDGSVYWTWAGGLDPQSAMCPATEIWREKLAAYSKELVGTLRMDGVYFDYFTVHCNDCFVKEHGHPLGGGNYWTKSVHDLYAQVRGEVKKVKPETILCGEDEGEWVIDVTDAAYGGGPWCDAPVFMVVYHGYHQVFGGTHNMNRAEQLGRPWLWGKINGPTNQLTAFAEAPNRIYQLVGPFLQKLVRCSWEFAYPYLGYGEMLRPPKVEGDFPILTANGPYGEFPVPAVEGAAWRAPDGSVGIFLLNYDMDNAHEVTWREDLGEIAGIGADARLTVTCWDPEQGIVAVGEWSGGVLEKTTELPPLGIVALKLEVKR
ncbi:MAG: DUF6259 domain-containing protein [Planctomycetota bacterium]